MLVPAIPWVGLLGLVVLGWIGWSVYWLVGRLVGVRQGCVLSPCLFSLFIADLPKFLAERGGTGVKVYTSYITCILFADDGAIVADTKEDLQ